MNDDLASAWRLAESAVIAGNAAALERLLRDHPELLTREPPPYVACGPGPGYANADARSIVTRQHHFRTFDDLTKYHQALQRGDPEVTQFEAAVEAIITGNVPTLRRLLQERPGLIRERSARTHRAMLLHYVGANGVEGWRQKTPPNAVEVAKVLLDAGAEVDALGEMYGGSTALGLVATSIHPLRAGVQNDLMELLLQYGAAMDHPRGAGNSQCIVNGALANGRPTAAEFLASRGAHLDLEGAAGVGELAAVRSFFNNDGSLKPNATRAQMKSGFQWACEYGRTEVVEFLLRQGINVGEIHRGQTGLHWAAYGGHADIVKLLLERKAPVNIRDESWNNTPLGWAIYGWTNPPPESSHARHHDVVELLVAAGATVDPNWLSNEKIGADARMSAALRV